MSRTRHSRSRSKSDGEIKPGEGNDALLRGGDAVDLDAHVFNVPEQA